MIFRAPTPPRTGPVEYVTATTWGVPKCLVPHSGTRAPSGGTSRDDGDAAPPTHSPLQPTGAAMAIWKDQNAFRKEEVPAPLDPTAKLDPVARREPDSRLELTASHPAPSRMTERESLIAADLTIEGKIEGSGHVRIAGRFKGDVHVDGNLTLEVGAKLIGGVRANTVIIGGELEGNVTDAKRVELLESGVLTGDLKAGSFTVAAGSRMRGQVEFGWDDAHKKTPVLRVDASSSA